MLHEGDLYSVQYAFYVICRLKMLPHNFRIKIIL